MINIKTAAAIAASTLAGLMASGAQATTTNWSVHDPLESAFVFYNGQGATVISDEYTFSLLSGASYDIGSSLLGGGMFSFPLPTLKLYDSANVALFTMTLGDGTHYQANLAAGTYKYVVSGISTGFFGYGLSSSIVQTTPVPEPETYAMMLAGLGALGFLARRRQNS